MNGNENKNKTQQPQVSETKEASEINSNKNTQELSSKNLAELSGVALVRELLANQEIAEKLRAYETELLTPNETRLSKKYFYKNENGQVTGGWIRLATGNKTLSDFEKQLFIRGENSGNIKTVKPVSEILYKDNELKVVQELEFQMIQADVFHNMEKYLTDPEKNKDFEAAKENHEKLAEYDDRVLNAEAYYDMLSPEIKTAIDEKYNSYKLGYMAAINTLEGKSNLAIPSVRSWYANMIANQRDELGNYKFASDEK